MYRGYNPSLHLYVEDARAPWHGVTAYPDSDKEVNLTKLLGTT